MISQRLRQGVQNIKVLSKSYPEIVSRRCQGVQIKFNCWPSCCIWIGSLCWNKRSWKLNFIKRAERACCPLTWISFVVQLLENNDNQMKYPTTTMNRLTCHIIPPLYHLSTTLVVNYFKRHVFQRLQIYVLLTCLQTCQTCLADMSRHGPTCLHEISVVCLVFTMSATFRRHVSTWRLN